MPVRNLQTKASIQGNLPMQRGQDAQFSKATPISNGSTVAQRAAATIPNFSSRIDQKFQSLFFLDYDFSLSQVSQNEIRAVDQSFEESKINSDHAITSKMSEPAAIFMFQKSDIQNILSSLYQAYVEDACSQKFSEKMLQLAKEKNSTFFENLEKSIQQEMNETQAILDSLDLIISQIDHYDNDIATKFSITYSAKNRALKEYFAFFSGGVDPESRQSAFVADLNNFFTYTSKDSTDSIKNNEKLQTAIISQLLQIVSFTLRDGSTTITLGGKILDLPAGNSKISQKTIIGQDSKFLTLKTLAAGNSQSSCYIYGLPLLQETEPYTARVDLSSLTNFKSIKKIAYLTTLIANELTISAGLARVENTEIGARFQSNSSNYVQNLLGTSGMTDSLAETSAADSLVDCLVISDDGNQNVRASKNKKRVLLFDGTNFEPANLYTNATSEFLSGILKNPSDESQNKTLILEQSLKNAINSFEQGTEFLKKVYLADKKLSLLSPKGLFSKLLEIFATSLNGLQSTSPSSSSLRKELALLSLIFHSSNSKDGQDSANVIKRYIVSCLARTAIAGIRDYEVQYAKSGPKSSFGINISSSKIRFSNNDQSLIKGLFLQQEFTDELLLSFFSMSTSELDSTSAKKQLRPPTNISFTVPDVFQKPYQVFSSQGNGPGGNDGGDSFLDSLAQLFVSVYKEAEGFAQEQKAAPAGSTTAQTSYLVDTDGFTKNSKIDATTLLGALLESACLLAGMFISVKKTKNQNNEQIEDLIKIFKRSGQGLDANTKNKLLSSQLFLTVDADTSSTSESAAAISAVAKSALANNLSNLIAVKNGIWVIPSLNDMPIQKVISIDGSDLSPAVMIETMKDLADERAIPAAAFTIAKSFVVAADESSQKIIKTGKQLLGKEQQTSDLQIFSKFSKTSIAKKYFDSLNEFTISASRQSFNDLKSAWKSQAKRNPKINLGIYNCALVTLQEICAKNDSFAFLVAGLPTGFVKNSIKFNFSLKNDKDNTKKTELMKILIEKNSAFESTKYEPITFTHYVRPIFNDQSFAQFTAAANQFPISLSDISNKCLLDNGKNGLKEKSGKLDQKMAQEALENEVISYILRKIFSVLSSADLFEKDITTRDAQVRSANSSNIAKIFADIYGLPSTAFNSVFKSSESSGTTLEKSDLLNLAMQKFSDASSSIIYSSPVLTFGETELFYDLFSTVYFLAGRVNETVFAPTVLDRTAGVLFSPQNFRIYEKNSNVFSSFLRPISIEMDSYSIDVGLSTPLENS